MTPVAYFFLVLVRRSLKDHFIIIIIEKST